MLRPWQKESFGVYDVGLVFSRLAGEETPEPECTIANGYNG
jgi:hypothetical protein